MEGGDDGGDSSVPVVSSGDDRTAAEVFSPRFRPCRILDRSTSIAQREDNLARALVITVLTGSSGAILGSIASRFEVEVSLMSLQRFGDARFLLTLPDAELAGVQRWTTFHLNGASFTCHALDEVPQFHGSSLVISGGGGHPWNPGSRLGIANGGASPGGLRYIQGDVQALHSSRQSWTWGFWTCPWKMMTTTRRSVRWSIQFRCLSFPLVTPIFLDEHAKLPMLSDGV